MNKYSVAEFNDARDTVYEVLEKWVILSIESTFKVTSDPSQTEFKGSPLSAYLLLSCAIDIIAGFYSGRNPTNNRSSGREYKKFIEVYMNLYSPEILYKDLRCGLAHNFILGKGLGLTYAHPELHNTRNNTGMIVKNFDNLFSDFRSAFLKYFEDLDRSQDLQSKFMKRFKNGGILALNLENITGAEKNSPVLTNYRQKDRI